MKIEEMWILTGHWMVLRISFWIFNCSNFDYFFILKICISLSYITKYYLQIIFLHAWSSCCSVAKLCLTLCNPRDYSLPGSSVHEISQARMLGWVAISFSRGSFQTRDQTHVPGTGRQVLYRWGTREAPSVRFIMTKCINKIVLNDFLSGTITL